MNIFQKKLILIFFILTTASVSYASFLTQEETSHGRFSSYCKKSLNITKLFCSSILPNDFYDDMKGCVNHIYSMGPKGIAQSVYTSMKDNPLDVALLSCSILTGHSILPENYKPLLGIVGGSLGNLKFGHGILKKVQSRFSFNRIGNVLGYAGVGFMVAYLPASYALSTCTIPEGSFSGTCSNTTVQDYISSDPNVPHSCVLRTHCQTIIPSIPCQENVLYYAKGGHLELGNNNGTIVIQNPDGESLIPRDATCTLFPGSYQETCKVNIQTYTPNDQNLAYTHFCQMETNCKPVSGSNLKENQVYYAHDVDSRVNTIENCNGRLVLHKTPELDGMCAGETSDNIDKISKEMGSTHYVIEDEIN